MSLQTCSCFSERSCILHSAVYNAYPGVAWEALHYLLCEELDNDTSCLYHYLAARGWTPAALNPVAPPAQRSRSRSLSKGIGALLTRSNSQPRLLTKAARSELALASHRSTANSLTKSVRKKLGRLQSRSVTLSALSRV